MSFDLLAPHYRWMEFVLAGNKLQRCRTAHLKKVAGARRVLILGEGNGRFLVECRRALPNAWITCVDASALMLAFAEKRLRKSRLDSNRVELVHADALTWKPAEIYDVIVTHFFLDCFRSDQLASLIPRLVEVAAARCTWLVSDFQIPNGGLKAGRARIIVAIMYIFFRFAARLPAAHLCNPDSILEKCAFQLHERRESEWGLLRSDCWRRSGVASDGENPLSKNRIAATLAETRQNL